MKSNFAIFADGDNSIGKNRRLSPVLFAPCRIVSIIMLADGPYTVAR
jgi:hypothetical protein